MDNKDNYKQIVILITTATEACVIITNLSEVSLSPVERGRMWTGEVKFAMGGPSEGLESGSTCRFKAQEGGKTRPMDHYRFCTAGKSPKILIKLHHLSLLLIKLHHLSLPLIKMSTAATQQ